MQPYLLQVATKKTRMLKTDVSITLIDELQKTYSVIGCEKTVQSLVFARNLTVGNSKIKKLFREEELKDQLKKLQVCEIIEKEIIKAVCDVFKISIEKLYNGASKGNRTDALKVIYVLAKKHLDYSLEDIRYFMRKDKAVISKAIFSFNNLNPELKQDRDLIAKATEAEDLLLEYIKQKKHKSDAET